VLGDLSLLAFMATVKSDDGAGRTIWCVETALGVWFDEDVLVIIPSMDLEFLVMPRLIVDCDFVRHDGKGAVLTVLDIVLIEVKNVLLD
jgi:hypothetical protein